MISSKQSLALFALIASMACQTSLALFCNSRRGKKFCIRMIQQGRVPIPRCCEKFKVAPTAPSPPVSPPSGGAPVAPSVPSAPMAPSAPTVLNAAPIAGTVAAPKVAPTASPVRVATKSPTRLIFDPFPSLVVPAPNKAPTTSPVGLKSPTTTTALNPAFELVPTRPLFDLPSLHLPSSVVPAPTKEPTIKPPTIEFLPPGKSHG
jgi:hypothetical protein